MGLFPPCSATLEPGGPCEQEGDGCPFVVNLPPMTVNLPKQLMDLERLVEELQILKNNVDQLRKICKDCGANQAEKECTGGSKQDADDGNFNVNRQIWENNKRVVNEDRRKDGKSPKDKTEQVVAAGKNVRISERKKVDRKQIDRALDKQNSPLGNATTHMQNRTIGKSEVWGDQMMDNVMVVRDCSDHVLRGHTKSGLYLVTPDPSGGSVQVLCDMEEDGGGWTVLQRRHDGSVNFNRSWAEYRDGFGQLDGGEFWLGNNRIHLLTRDRNMELRVELEDFEGLQAYAQYQLFKVLSERMRFRLLVDGYSGTAGDAFRFNTNYNHNNRAFTTPDRDNDRYPSGNCGAYYSSGWWFDACMAANLNGRYYKGRYKGVRDGIYWGTWHNISTEYYPTNERLSFKSVRMMIRPKGFKP
ncbi:hypothetical protein NQD34_004248 [Periophthalmus magnuspinnatus]|nr:hypothetical protein NQD34_004248 [Periophthalmus magnuspinnatus]